jgi:hypothetical protein
MRRDLEELVGGSRSPKLAVVSVSISIRRAGISNVIQVCAISKIIHVIAYVFRFLKQYRRMAVLGMSNSISEAW